MIEVSTLLLVTPDVADHGGSLMTEAGRWSQVNQSLIKAFLELGIDALGSSEMGRGTGDRKEGHKTLELPRVGFCLYFTLSLLHSSEQFP